jgi:hypothetical protein
MTKARGLLIVGLLLCASPSFAAVITLDGVEWQTIGIVDSITGTINLPRGEDEPITVSVGPSPTGGNQQWLLLESGNESPLSASVGALEGFFGMSSGFLSSRGYFSGAGIMRDFVLPAGGDLRFDATFVTADIFANDAAMFVMDSDGEVIASAHFDETGIVNTGWFETGGPLLPGTYSIGLAVLNDFDTCCSSYLGVDNFRIGDTPLGELEPVPEPATLLLLTAGWGTAVVSRRYFAGRKER